MELEIVSDMSLISFDDTFSFYLQDYYVNDCIENSMVFVELENLKATQEFILSLQIEIISKQLEYMLT